MFVGPLAAIEAAYVAVDDVLYKVDSALHAVNLCFSIYFALEVLRCGVSYKLVATT